MTIEELAKLKKGDKLMWRGNVVTLNRVQVVVTDNGGDARLNLEFLDVIPGPTLPPHVAEIWEWDGGPKQNGSFEGWVWDDTWPWPRYDGGNYYHGVYRLIRKLCACQKESE